ncbi:MAG: hypothetical protein JRJ85_10570 [Deltaproteobacteria bacterium]|nr:hypothetical protein [Deltaproteobacteria bacterium]
MNRGFSYHIIKVLAVLSRSYKGFALIIFNTIALFIIVNIGLWALFSVTDKLKTLPTGVNSDNPVSRKHKRSLDDLYPDLNREEVDLLLGETWSRHYVYESYTQFKERPFKGKHVNVDANGFRISINQGPWPPDKNNYNIFLFGGSTVFNYGIQDEKTIASYIQMGLSAYINSKEIKVYNFGRGNYYLTQEMILFERLLISGTVPDMAIFIDGLNEFYYYDDRARYTDRLEELVRASLSRYIINRKISKLPVHRAILALKDFMQDKDGNDGVELHDNSKGSGDEASNYNDKALLMSVVERYVENKRIIDSIGNTYGVKTIFVWQPIPTYKHESDKYYFGKGGFGRHAYSKYGYFYMAEFIKENHLGKNFIWCADMQEGITEPLYIDVVHYSGKMSEMVARKICETLHEREFLN